MHSNKDPAYFTTGRYTSGQMRQLLQRKRQRIVPKETLKYWRKRLEIKPDEHNLYTQFDLDILKGLIDWLRVGGTIYHYRRTLEQRSTDDA